MNETEKAAHEYVAKEYPGRTFSNVMAVTLYLEEVKGVKRQNAAGKVEGTKPQIYPGETRPCPLCGGTMRKFALCSNCSLYSKGYVAQWICLRSKGVLQKVHTNRPAEKGEVSYADFLAYAKTPVDMADLTCRQEGILLKEGED